MAGEQPVTHAAPRRLRPKLARSGREGVAWGPGWLAVIFLVGLLHAGLYALLTPAWQAPDEPGHVEYACLLATVGRTPRPTDRTAALQQEIIASLTRHDFWQRVRQPPPAALPAAVAADPFLARSGRQIGDETPLYYVGPALVCALGRNTAIEARLTWIRLWGAVLFGLSAVATAWAWQSTFGLRQALLLAALPMPAFIAGSANNDALAMLTASAVFAAVVRAQRLGWSRRRLLGLALLLALALLSKKTNAFLVPWLATVGAVAGWRRLSVAPTWRQRRGRALAGLALAAGLAVWLLLLPTQAPAGWRSHRQPLGEGRVALAERPGTWAVRVVDTSTDDTGRLFQNIIAPRALALRGQPLSASITVRAADHAPQPGRLTVRDAGGTTQVQFTAADEWQRVSLTHTVALTTTYVKLIVAAVGDDPSGGLLVNDAALTPPTGANLLRNADFDHPARWGELLIVAPLERRWEQFAPRLLSGAAFDRAALQRYALYTALLFPGFWGNFGWLQRPLPLWMYAALAVVCLMALLGLRRATPAPAEPASFVPAWLLAVALVLLQTLIPMLGRAWQPQGRYLFPALFPLTGLLLVGLGGWLEGPRQSLRWGLALALLLMLNVMSLLRAAFIF